MKRLNKQSEWTEPMPPHTMGVIETDPHTIPDDHDVEQIPYDGDRVIRQDDPLLITDTDINLNLYDDQYEEYAYDRYDDEYAYPDDGVYYEPLYTDDSGWRMGFLLAGIALVSICAIMIVGQFILPGAFSAQDDNDNILPPASGQTARTIPTTISPVFMPSVLHWEWLILEWSAAYNVDPNAIATIMQIESCGYESAQSHAGAMGLFQVMPFHFTATEDMLDPNTNAMRGVAYFSEGMRLTNDNTYLSLAGYNAGHGKAAQGWDNWPSETQRYYVWSKGIYDEASSGETNSDTLQQWLNAGGRSLCDQAERRIGL